jgi:hypothetical protein
MKPKSVVGMLGVVAMVLLLSPSWAAADTAIQLAGEAALDMGGVLTFKTSPNVLAHMETDSGAFGDGTGTTYIAGTVHRAGDRAYGVDPDYTGMFVGTVPVGTEDAFDAGGPTIPPVAGDSTDFGTGWTAK